MNFHAKIGIYTSLVNHKDPFLKGTESNFYNSVGGTTI